MPKIAGRLSTLEISTDGGTTYLEVKGAADMTLNGSTAELTTTSHDSGGFEEYIPGRSDFTIDLSLRHDEADPGQDLLQDSFFSKTVVDWRFRMQVFAGLDEYKVKGFISSLSPAGPNDDVASMDATIRCTGVMTRSSQV